jgi:large subunit ribosomal protein L5e
VDGEYYSVYDNYADGKQPFKAVLDIGLVATTTGNRCFGALKGAVDGGLNIPHNTKRFPGFSKSADKEEVYDAKAHRERIFGVHVDNYMKTLKEEGAEEFKKQFGNWAKTLTAANVKTVESLYVKAHKEIRKNPVLAKKADKKNPDRKHK